MKRDKTGSRVRRANVEANQKRGAVEMLIDEIGSQSFPASDPPAWGVVSSRLEEASQSSQPRKGARGFRNLDVGATSRGRR
jgi:hypothetical protein